MDNSRNPSSREMPHRAWPRRECLKAAGAAGLALLGTQLFGGPPEDLKARAKKNLKPAIFSNVYASLPLEEAAKRIKADGFVGVVTDHVFADARFDPSAPDWETAKKITDCFDRHGIKICAIAAYTNIVDPVPEKRKRGHERLEFFLTHWKRLGSPIICTETGTLNRQSEWLESPENATEESYLQCRGILERLAKAAEKTGAVVSIEPYWRNLIDSIERAARLFREVDTPALRLIMDPCNYFRKEDLARMRPMLEEMFTRLGPKIVLAHAKDVKASAAGTDLPASGLGVLDYPLYLGLLAKLDREMYLVVEHLALPDVPRARDYVLGQFDKVR